MMWRIRKRSKSQSENTGGNGGLPDRISPRVFCRAVLAQMRFIHKWHPKLVEACALLPADEQKVYEVLVGAELRPSFDEVLRLIEYYRQYSLITDDEAASLRAGQFFEIALPEATQETMRGKAW